MARRESDPIQIDTAELVRRMQRGWRSQDRSLLDEAERQIRLRDQRIELLQAGYRNPQALETVLVIAKSVATMEDPTCLSSEIAPEDICFYCGMEVKWDRGLRNKTVQHRDTCDVVRLREALEVLSGR